MTPQQVLITRPEPGASELARALGGGIVSPLTAIEPRPFEMPAGIRAILLTSANGARALGPWRGGARRAFCVGERTAREAAALGYEAEAAGGDAEALVAHVARIGGGAGPLLHVRGAHARGDVAARLTSAGLSCGELVAYDQPERPLTGEALDALGRAEPLLAPLYSPRAATLLAARARNAAAPLHIVALSPAVAEAAAPLGRAEVAASPDARAMLAAIRRRLADGGAGLDRPEWRWKG